ncbi:LIC_10190 family membrane protein [Methanospirillum stamsii]|uniref:DUF8201 domain-containing protein n=1 Tax=Methanospirillum stamsii TaxID=1277351 RepID=A0A2V2NIH1_9EURY|nr:hypothetical protein [Methanospirillum stamsii]PWR76148.1 hypothetical protein DLD82_01235 [Methanospirillum stamsii]
MLDILFFYLWFFLWIIAVIGIGKSIYKLFNIKNLIEYQQFEFGIVGIAIIIIIVGFVNFWDGFSLTCSLILFLCGLSGFFFFYPRKKFSLNSIKKEIFLGSIIFCAILTWFHPIHDTGGYHFTAINWIITQQIPFGLANLYSRLGFNTTWFLGEACFEQLVFFFHRPLFIMNGMLLFLYSSVIISIFNHSFKDNKNMSCFEKIQTTFQYLTAGEMFLILSIFPVILMTGYFISTASPDFPVFILIIMIFAFSIQLINKKLSGISWYNQILFIGFLIFFVLSIKTSSIPLVFFLVGLIFIKAIFNKNGLKNNFHTLKNFSHTKTTFLFFAIIASLIVIFLLRGLILSGNPLFPMNTPIQFNLPWNVPKEITIETMNEVIIPARLYTNNDLSLLSDMKWVFPWSIVFIKKNITLLVIWMTTIVSIITFLINERPLNIKRLNIIEIQKILIFFSLIIALVFWFFSAPDPRFGYGFLYALPLFLIVFPIVGKEQPNPRWFVNLISRILCFYLVMVGLLIIAMFVIWGFTIPHYPDISYSLEKSANDELIFFSHSWDQIWDMPLPNTPEDIYSKIIIEKNPNNKGYHMFSFNNSLLRS